MLFLIPLVILIALIVAIDHIYFSDVTPKDTSSKTEVHQKGNENNATQKYLDRYIKK
ncbi:hypothetical protein [Sulfurospirillum oryzae]|uniref:hypothetical protein n=1 Tax=Sulfurospirillum oryzae TaxID=2976535 RepID=UPI0021E8B752|nr:hypothetical protein [Sulfurospirillum oryzae]